LVANMTNAPVESYPLILAIWPGGRDRRTGPVSHQFPVGIRGSAVPHPRSCVEPTLEPLLSQIFLGQRRSDRLGLHHDARNSPSACFFERLNAVDAARDLLPIALQRVAAP